MKIIIAKWLGNINGSRYSLHQTKTFKKTDVLMGIDALGDPEDTEYIIVPENLIPKVEFFDGYYEPSNAIDETELKNLWHKLESGELCMS
jgi:hypothetical protein